MTTSIAIEPTYRIISRLADVRQRSPTQWSACCPAHDDTTKSLEVGVGSNGNAVLHCFAGCSTADVLRSLSLGMSSLFPSRSEPARGSRSKSGKSGKSSTSGKISKIYPYLDQSGELLFEVCRYEPKEFRQRRPDASGMGRIHNMHGVTKLLYHADLLAKADPATPVYVVEGEKDADRLISAGGLLATTAVGGAGSGKWEPQYSEQLRGRHVLVIPDIDKPHAKTGRPVGMDQALIVAHAIDCIAASVKIVALPDLGKLTPKWDVSDWIDAGGTKEQFKAAVESSPPFDPVANPLPAASPGSTSTAHTGDQPNESETDPHRLARIFAHQSQHADGLTLRYWRENYYQWKGAAYKPLDQAESRALVTSCTKREFDRLNLLALENWEWTEDEPLPPECKPVTTTIVGHVRQALTGECLVGSSIDMPCWLDGRTSPGDTDDAPQFIPMANGLLDLRTLLTSDQEGPDEPPATIPHTPAYFSTTCLPYAYDPLAACPKWMAFIDHNLESDPDRIDLLQEWFGLNVVNDMTFQKFLLMEGEGSNGKSVICAAIEGMVGRANCSHVPLEAFGERFGLYQTVGKLANIASEVGEIDKVAEGFLKSFTSGDRMTFDRKNQSAINEIPTARITLATNNRPRFSDKSGGVWRRMILLPLRVKIADEHRVAGMDKSEWWHAQGELPGLFNWAVQGLRRLRSRGRFTESHVSTEAKAEYRADSNPVRAFFEDNYHETSLGAVLSKDIYSHYRKWCDESGTMPMADRQFGKELKRVFPSVDRIKRGTRADRYYMYTGIDTGGTGDEEEEDIDRPVIDWPAT